MLVDLFLIVHLYDWVELFYRLYIELVHIRLHGGLLVVQIMLLFTYSPRRV